MAKINVGGRFLDLPVLARRSQCDVEDAEGLSCVEFRSSKRVVKYSGRAVRANKGVEAVKLKSVLVARWYVRFLRHCVKY